MGGNSRNANVCMSGPSVCLQVEIIKFLYGPKFREGSEKVQSGMVQGWFKDGSRMVQGWFRDGSGMVQGWFKEGSRKVQGSFLYLFHSLEFFCLDKFILKVKEGIG